MDLNSIKLSPDLIEDLYRNALIYSTGKEEKKSEKMVSDTKEKITAVPELKWKTLGNNHKNVLLVLRNPGIPFLPDTDLEFLTTILKACKLNLDDVAILNIANHEQAQYKEIIEFFKSRIVLLFDHEPAAFGLPMNFPHYQIQPFAGCSFLYAPSLKILEMEIEEKKKLWSSLKRLFNI